MRGRMGLAVSDLTCARGGRLVLHGVGFALAPGEVLVLRGPNGAGKSTLLRVLAGLVPARGRVALGGRVLDRDARAEAVAYAGHLDAVKPPLSVEENLRFWAGVLGGDASRALAALDLATMAERPAHLLSAGQKRRLGLARLMLAPRRLWLLDEPTVSLDEDAVTRLLDAVRGHCAGGGMAVIATHADLDLAPSRELLLGATAPGPDAADPFLAGAWG